jgi:hypothetical protein
MSATPTPGANRVFLKLALVIGICAFSIFGLPNSRNNVESKRWLNSIN